jgi:hypothetical protein
MGAVVSCAFGKEAYSPPDGTTRLQHDADEQPLLPDGLAPRDMRSYFGERWRELRCERLRPRSWHFPEEEGGADSRTGEMFASRFNAWADTCYSAFVECIGRDSLSMPAFVLLGFGSSGEIELVETAPRGSSPQLESCLNEHPELHFPMGQRWQVALSLTRGGVRVCRF